MKTTAKRVCVQCGQEREDRFFHKVDHGGKYFYKKCSGCRRGSKQPGLMPRMAAETLEQRLLQRMKVDPVTGCWLWQAGKDKDGYGRVQYKRRWMRAHRAAWEVWRGGAIPQGYVVCHHCDTPACIRPSHIFCGTVSDNTRDAFSKGRRVLPKNLNPKYPHWLVKWARTRTRAYWKSRKRNARGDKFAK